MLGKMQQEMQRDRPFDSLHQEVFLNLGRTADHLQRGFDELFKPFNLSFTQYGVLRILSFAGEGGLACKKIGERMITRDPDITRLLDRLEARKLIARQRGTNDRRVVAVHITAEGTELLKELERPVLDFHSEQLAHVPEASLTRLIEVLEMIREADASPARTP